MNWQKGVRYLTFSLVVIPLVMAAVQFYFYEFGGLTSWKGGGFGMYSDPHPNDSRITWLVGIRDGKKTAFRIDPRDPETDIDSVTQKEVVDLLFELEGLSDAHRNFPEVMVLHMSFFLKDELRELIQNEPALKHFPIDNIEIQLYQVEIDNSFKNLEAKLQYRSAMTWRK